MQDNRTGMDIAQIRSLASQMRSRAESFRSMAGDVTARLEAVEWRGPDRDRLLDEWRAGRRGALLALAAALDAAANAASRSAQAQAEASRR